MPTMTAAQRREQARREFDAYLAACPSRKLLNRLSDKWVTLVVCALGDAGRPMRSSELSRRIAGASQKMLTQTLRALERDGLVSRQVTPTVPVTVEYGLTGLGTSLLSTLAAFKTWAEAHYSQVEAAQLEHDAARAPAKTPAHSAA